MQASNASSQYINEKDQSIPQDVPLSKSNTGLIVVLALIGILLLSAAILIPIFVSKDKGKSPIINSNSTSTSTTTTPATTTTPTTTSTDNDSNSYTTNIGGTSVTYKTKNLISSDTTLNSGEYTSSESDETVFLITNGTLTLNPGVKVTKTGSSRRLQGPEEGGGTSDADSYSFYGINSAIVVLGSGKAVINGVTITTSSYGSNAVVATNGGTIDIKNSVISTEGDSSRGIHATYSGVITAENVTITTQGGSCANIATDRGEGTITATKMTLSTAGAGSPLIYSTGEITVSDSTGSSTGAQIVVVEGKNSVILTNCQFTATGVGNRNNVDKSGIMVYQSMSGDADTGTGTFEAHDSTLTILESSSVYDSAPMFFITNIEAIITLENTSTSFGSNVFMNATATDEWGNSGNNGGIVSLTVTEKAISGKLYADSSSSITFNHDSSMSDNDVTTEGDGNISVSTTGS